MINDMTCTPVFGRLIRSEIAVARDDGVHTGGKACLDVPQVIAQINAFSWVDIDFLAGDQQRLGVRFGFCGFIAADYAGDSFF